MQTNAIGAPLAGQPHPLGPLAYLASINQWILVLLVPKANGKIDKIPCDHATGMPHGAHDAQVWTTYGTALGRAQQLGSSYTVGFVLTPAAGLVCLDIDNARQTDGTWSPLAQQLAAALPGSVLELSLSGRGLHAWCRHKNPPPHRSKRVDLGIELYSHSRFICIGTHQTGTLADHCDALPALISKYFPPRERAAEEAPIEGPCEGYVATLSDEEIIKRAMQSRSMAAALNGKATFADLWTANADVLGQSYRPDPGSTEPFDRSSADAALASHLLWWTGKDRGRAERLMRRSALARDKYERPDYLPRTIDNACAGVSGFYGQASAPTVSRNLSTSPSLAGALTIEQRRNLPFSGAAAGLISARLETVIDTLQSPESGYRIARDVFQERLMVDDDQGQWRPFEDVDYGLLRANLGRRGFKPISSDIIKTAVQAVAESNRFDSLKDWADSLKWDGVSRVETAMSKYFGTVDTEYTRAVALYLFTALAGRALSPGCQADMVIVLIGLQGARKTSAVRALSPDPKFFAEINLKKLDEDNLARHVRGKVIGEIAELRGLQGRDAESVKAWITRRDEVWRPLYQEFEVTYPRRLVFIGTTNEREFLHDPTGERRWLPLEAGSVDVESLERDCEQLWAEGVARYRAGGIAWRAAEDLARAEHGNFKLTDPWQEAVERWAAQPVDPMKPKGAVWGLSPFRLADVCGGALQRSVDKLTMPDLKRLGAVLRALGYEKCVVRVDGANSKLWRRAGLPLPPEPNGHG